MHQKFNVLIGAFEIALWMKSGFNRFNDDFRSMLKSFVIVGISFVFVLLSAPYIQNIQNSEINSLTPSASTLLNTQILYGVKFVVTTALSLIFMYFMMYILKREPRFIRFISVSNWCSLIPLLAFLPIYFGWLMGFTDYEQSYPFLIVISIYFYALTAFIIRYIVDIPWELAIFITVCLFFIDDFSFKILGLITT